MKRHASKQLRDTERMVAATKQLEALLRDAGPGITITPTSFDDDADFAPGLGPGAIAPDRAASLTPQTGATPATRSRAGSGRAPTIRGATQPTAATAPAPRPQAAKPASPSPSARATLPEASRQPGPAPATPPSPQARPSTAAARPAADVARGAETTAPQRGTEARPAQPGQIASQPAPSAHAPSGRPAATAQPAPHSAATAATDTPPAAAAPSAQRQAGAETPLSEVPILERTAPLPAPKPSAGKAYNPHAPRKPAPAAPRSENPTRASAIRAAAPAAAVQEPPQQGIDAFRAAGFTGFIIDWLLPGRSDLKSAIARSARAFGATGLFSFAINILMLAGPLFMLQVYDRVMTSGSIPTLVALFAITAGLYGVIGVLELARSRIVVRIGVEVDKRLSERIFRASLKRTLANPGQSMPALRELDNLRQFVASQGPLTFFDAPWTPVYLLVIFLVHWILGIAALVGGALLVGLAWMSESRSRGPIMEAGKASVRSLELAETGQRNAEAITAMGMLSAYIGRWQRANGDAIAWQTLATDRLGGMSAVSKTARLLLQSFMLAIGAWLAVRGDISAGSIIAGTIIFGRALAPVEQGIQHWRGFLKARESYLKLDDLLAREPVPPRKTALPAPTGHLEVTALRVAAPDTRQLILANLAFRVEPGQMLAVIGPSASGKSTLARTLVGLWPPFSGLIELDGARLDQWDGEALGQYVGYLPQNVELFSGTVRENIARFRDEASDDDVMSAARMAHAHEMILALPQGYDTELGNFGTYLSAGQRQRIGLARALFGNPALVVLDEPNANLDRSGDEALSSAIDGMRARGQSIVLVSHRVQAIGKADLLLYLDRGMQRAFGPRAEVMRMIQGQQSPQPQPQQQAAPAQPNGGAQAAAAARNRQAAPTDAQRAGQPANAASAPVGNRVAPGTPTATAKPEASRPSGTPPNPAPGGQKR